MYADFISLELEIMEIFSTSKYILWWAVRFFTGGGDFGVSPQFLILVPILGVGDAGGSVEDSILRFHPVWSYCTIDYNKNICLMIQYYLST